LGTWQKCSIYATKSDPYIITTQPQKPQHLSTPYLMQEQYNDHHVNK